MRYACAVLIATQIMAEISQTLLQNWTKDCHCLGFASYLD
ncbi:hypothetical protein [Acinetobacter pittii]